MKVIFSVREFRDWSAITALRKLTLLFAIAFFFGAVIVHAQSGQEVRLTEIERRIANIEDLAKDVAVLKSEIDQVVWYAKTGGGVILLLLIERAFAVFGLQVMRKPREKSE